MLVKMTEGEYNDWTNFASFVKMVKSAQESGLQVIAISKDASGAVITPIDRDTVIDALQQNEMWAYNCPNDTIIGAHCALGVSRSGTFEVIHCIACHCTHVTKHDTPAQIPKMNKYNP